MHQQLMQIHIYIHIYSNRKCILLFAGCRIFEGIGFESFNVKKDRYVQYLARLCQVVSEPTRDWMNHTDVTLRLKFNNKRQYQNCHLQYQDDK